MQILLQLLGTETQHSALPNGAGTDRSESTAKNSLVPQNENEKIEFQLLGEEIDLSDVELGEKSKLDVPQKMQEGRAAKAVLFSPGFVLSKGRGFAKPIEPPHAPKEKTTLANEPTERLVPVAIVSTAKEKAIPRQVGRSTEKLADAPTQGAVKSLENRNLLQAPTEPNRERQTAIESQNLSQGLGTRNPNSLEKPASSAPVIPPKSTEAPPVRFEKADRIVEKFVKIQPKKTADTVAKIEINFATPKRPALEAKPVLARTEGEIAPRDALQPTQVSQEPSMPSSDTRTTLEGTPTKIARQTPITTSADVAYRPSPLPKKPATQPQEIVKEAPGGAARTQSESAAKPENLIAPQIPKASNRRTERGQPLPLREAAFDVDNAHQKMAKQPNQSNVAQLQPANVPLANTVVSFEKSSLVDSVQTRDLAFQASTDGPEIRRDATAVPKIETFARPVIHQLTQAAKSIGDGTVEVRLAPEELGRIRLAINPGETQVAVHITAERPETADLLRRNIELFTQSLRQEGFSSNLSFSFGGSGSDQPNGENDRNPKRFLGEKAPSETAAAAITSRQVLTPGQLDIRI